MNNCPKCHKEKAIMHPMYGMLPGVSCRNEDRKKVKTLTPLPEFATLTMRDRVVDQRTRYEKDIIQPFAGDGASPDPEFVKAYPELAPEYFTPEQLEKL